jgi:hypothetical protein
MNPRASLPALALLLGACATAAPPPALRCPDPSAKSVSPAQPGAPASPASSQPEASALPSLSITLTPVLAQGTVRVELHARGPAGALGTLTMRPPDKGAVQLPAAHDARGPLDLQSSVIEGALVVRPARPVEGELALAYVVQTRVPLRGGMPWVAADPDRLELSGEALLLPEALDDRKVLASLRIAVEVYGTQEGYGLGTKEMLVAGGASSFGVGAARTVEATVGELRRAVFLAGRMGTAVFDTPEGHDEAAWFGYTTFDPRPVAADVAGFRTAVGELFGDRSATPESLLIVPVPGPAGSFVAARRTRGVIVHVPVAEPWSGPVRVAVGVETLHAWIGSRLWIGPEAPAREAEGTWFAQGVARHLSRDLLFRFGLITPAEVADEVNGLESVVATSPRRKESNAALAAVAGEPGVAPLLVARGALYALRVDAAIRAKSGGKRSLSDVLKALYGKAREKRGPLSTSAWIEAVTAELGADEAKAFGGAIERGDALEIPDGALGPCFKRENRRYEPFVLGFDEAATKAKEPRAITGLVQGGPAEKAGVKEGDVLLESDIVQGRSDVPVKLVLERAGKQMKVEYRPAGPAAPGRGWVRRKDVGDEACTR